MKSLAVKYRPKDFNEVSGQSYTVDILEHQIENNLIKQGYLFSGPSGCGKSLVNGTPILTTKGWIPIQNAKVGTNVFSDDGIPYPTRGVYDQGLRDCYRFTFDNGENIIASDEHIWKVSLPKVFNYYRLLTSDQMYLLYKKHSNDNNKLFYNIKNSNAIQFTEKSYHINPELMGFFLRYVNIRNNHFIIILKNPDDIKIKQLLENYGIIIAHSGKMNIRGRRGFIFDVIEDKNNYFYDFTTQNINNYAHNSLSIPQDYLFGSIQQRIDLLKYFIVPAKKGNIFVFDTAHKSLATSLAQLVNSLGCKAKVFNNSDSDNLFRVQMFFSYHIAALLGYRLKGTSKKLTHRIINIEKLSKQYHCTCIETSAPSKMFITQGYIPTHNTTVARIFANKLHNTEIIELDAASNNSVDDIRGLIKEAGFQSIKGGYKVFIIDECHSLSNQAWQSLLKTLEEPPQKCIFIFCTTESHKVPITIQNRLQAFRFTRMTTHQIVERLKHISEQEKIKIDNSVLHYIAKISRGGMRDAIAYLEKCISIDVELTIDNVLGILSMTDYHTMLTLIDKEVEFNNKLYIIDDEYKKGTDLRYLINQMVLFILDLIKYQATNDFNMTDIPNTYFEDITNFLSINECLELSDLLSKYIKLQQLIAYETHPKPIIESFLVENYL